MPTAPRPDDGSAWYTPVTAAGRDLMAGAVVKAAGHSALVGNRYSWEYCATYDLVNHIGPHFKVAGITEVGYLIDPGIDTLLEVAFAPEDVLARHEPGHSDVVSHFRLHTSLCVAALRVQRRFDLTAAAELCELLDRSEGCRGRFLLRGLDTALAPAVLARGAYSSYAEVASRRPDGFPMADLLHRVATSGDLPELGVWLARHPWTLDDLARALPACVTGPGQAAILAAIRALPPGPRDDRHGNVILAAVAASCHWGALPDVVRRFASPDQVSACLVQHGRRMTADELKRVLEECFPATLPDRLQRQLVADALCRGAGAVVALLDGDGTVRADLCRSETDGHPPDAPWSEGEFLAAVQGGRFYAATLRPLPRPDSAVALQAFVKAAEQGYTAIVRWLEAQGVTGAPFRETCRVIAERNGYDELASALGRQPTEPTGGGREPGAPN